MRKTLLGRSGIAVSAIGFGCGPTAHLMIEGSARERSRVVGAAVEAGINYFDTAAQYGDGLSETHLGETLKEIGARPVIGTKVTLGLADLDDISAAIRASVEGSLKRLGVGQVDVVHLHNRVGAKRAARPNIGSGALLSIDDVLGPGGAAETLQSLKQEGLVRAIGCCAFGGESEAIAEVTESKAFDSILVNYSALNPTAWTPDPNALPDYEGIGARAAGAEMGIIALRVLEAGKLTGPVAQADLPLEVEARLQHLGLLEAEEDLAQAALRFALANQEVSTILVGISNQAQLDAALKAAQAR